MSMQNTILLTAIGEDYAPSYRFGSRFVVFRRHTEISAICLRFGEGLSGAVGISTSSMGPLNHTAADLQCHVHALQNFTYGISPVYYFE